MFFTTGAPYGILNILLFNGYDTSLLQLNNSHNFIGDIDFIKEFLFMYLFLIGFLFLDTIINITNAQAYCFLKVTFVQIDQCYAEKVCSVGTYPKLVSR